MEAGFRVQFWAPFLVAMEGNRLTGEVGQKSMYCTVCRFVEIRLQGRENPEGWRYGEESYEGQPR